MSSTCTNRVTNKHGRSSELLIAVSEGTPGRGRLRGLRQSLLLRQAQIGLARRNRRSPGFEVQSVPCRHNNSGDSEVVGEWGTRPPMPSRQASPEQLGATIFEIGVGQKSDSLTVARNLHGIKVDKAVSE